MATMSGPIESTYQGYISSTHDALLIFECVRRGIMPKVKRRLRDDERRLIRSGQVFVFDEKESGIKRWTDGLLWSPSRILWNFLVYRQVEKRQSSSKGGPSQSADAFSIERSRKEASIEQKHVGSMHLDHSTSGNHVGQSMFHAFADRPITASVSVLEQPGSVNRRTQGWKGHSSAHVPGQTRLRSASAVDGSTRVWQTMTLSEGSDVKRSSMQPSGRSATNERDLVGSLTTSYPFAKDGLCKKTISIHTETSTQHLISYYNLEDVRSGRLCTPSALPEIASLAISPVFLTKTTFRFPPVVTVGPDNIPRFRTDETHENQELSLQQYEQESNHEGANFVSDQNNPFVSLVNAPPGVFPHSILSPQVMLAGDHASALTKMSATDSPSALIPGQQTKLMVHAGSGLHAGQRNQGVCDVATPAFGYPKGRYEPYKVPQSGLTRITTSAPAGMTRPRAGTVGASSISTSPSSTPSTPYIGAQGNTTGDVVVYTRPNTTASKSEMHSCDNASRPRSKPGSLRDNKEEQQNNFFVSNASLPAYPENNVMRGQHSSVNRITSHVLSPSQNVEQKPLSQVPQPSTLAHDTESAVTNRDRVRAQLNEHYRQHWSHVNTEFTTRKPTFSAVDLNDYEAGATWQFGDRKADDGQHCATLGFAHRQGIATDGEGSRVLQYNQGNPMSMSESQMPFASFSSSPRRAETEQQERGHKQPDDRRSRAGIEAALAGQMRSTDTCQHVIPKAEEQNHLPFTETLAYLQNLGSVTAGHETSFAHQASGVPALIPTVHSATPSNYGFENAAFTVAAGSSSFANNVSSVFGRGSPSASPASGSSQAAGFAPLPSPNLSGRYGTYALHRNF